MEIILYYLLFIFSMKKNIKIEEKGEKIWL